MDTLSFLATPFEWWRVRHPAIITLNFILPGLAALLFGCAVALLPPSLNLFGEYGLVHQANGLMQILAGFYIASLAAIATFNKPGLDDVMQGDPPKLLRKGKQSLENLTRRKFLCLLFGYLSVAAIGLYILGAFSMMLAPELKAFVTNENVRTLARVGFIAVFSFFLTHALASTMLGIHYMAARLHTESRAGGFATLEGPKSEQG